MSKRTADDDRDRIRQAHGRVDPEESTRRIAEARRVQAHRIDVDAVHAAHVQEHGEPPAVIAARLDRTAVTPAALSIPCADHRAEPGEHCYRAVAGICRDRLRRSRRAAS
jgi:hypothetical protein